MRAISSNVPLRQSTFQLKKFVIGFRIVLKMRTNSNVARAISPNTICVATSRQAVSFAIGFYLKLSVPVFSASATNYQFFFSDQVKYGPNSGSHQNALFLVLNGSYGEATLQSPLIHQSYLLCQLTFAYQYNRTEESATTGLKVHIDLMDQDSRVLIWESEVQQLPQNKWIRFTVNLQRVRHPYQIVFSAYELYHRNVQFQALDNIRLDTCGPPTIRLSCEEFVCRNKACIPLIFVCDGEDDCGDFSDEDTCDPALLIGFENGFGNCLDYCSEIRKLFSKPANNQEHF